MFDVIMDGVVVTTGVGIVPAFREAKAIKVEYPDSKVEVENTSTQARVEIQVNFSATNMVKVAKDAAHDLMPAALRESFPKLYSTENVRNPPVIAKYFTPDGNLTWYATEFDGEDTFFGYVVSQEREYGYFTLSQLQSARGRFGLRVERDLYFTGDLDSVR